MAEQKKKKSNRGGARPGAGRPRSSTSKLQTFRAIKEVAEYLEKQPNKSSVINQSLVQYIQADNAAKLGTVIPATALSDAKMPFYDVKLVAGFPLPLDNEATPDEVNLAKMLTPNPESSYIIKVRGTSMVDANIGDGDLLVVDRSQRAPSESNISVCEFNGEYTVKYVRHIDGKLCLVPANPAFPVMPVGESD